MALDPNSLFYVVGQLKPAEGKLDDVCLNSSM
jgi:hypothetical protein